MARQYFRVKRGMVFWYEPPKSGTKTSVQQGNRPWLVVSNDDGNLSASTCNIVPMTTEDKTYIPTHVKTWINGQENVILCEQGITVDQNALKEFVCVMTDETMERVERALAIQYAIRPQVKYADFKLHNVVNKLESIIEEIIKNKVQQYHTTIPESDIEDSALRLGQMIEDLMGERSKEKPAELSTENSKGVDTSSSSVAAQKPSANATVKPYAQVTKPAAFEAKSVKPTGTPVKNTNPAGNTTQSRIKWTDEKRRQYLEDCEKMSPENVRVKYGFGSIGTVFSTKYSCKHILGLND